MSQVRGEMSRTEKLKDSAPRHGLEAWETFGGISTKKSIGMGFTPPPQYMTITLISFFQS